MTGTDTRAGDETQTAAPTSLHRLGSFVRELVIVVVGALVVSSLLRAFVGQMFSIPSQSMENTLLVGDRVLVQKVRPYERGDVVVFADPGGWLDEPADERGPVGQVLEFVGVLPDSSTEHLIKRVVGLPGDRVRCCDAQGRLTVNGWALEEQSYLYSDDLGSVKPSEVRFSVVVPAGKLFVMGDHRDLSADSRCHLSDISTGGRGSTAFVPEDLVVGEAFAVVAPLNRAEMLDRPPTFAEVPAPDEPAPSTAVIKPEGVTC